MKLISGLLCVVGALVCLLFVGLAKMVRPIALLALCWVVWHFTSKYW